MPTLIIHTAIRRISAPGSNILISRKEQETVNAWFRKHISEVRIGEYYT
jgi:hypothetical protein